MFIIHPYLKSLEEFNMNANDLSNEEFERIQKRLDSIEERITQLELKKEHYKNSRDLRHSEAVEDNPEVFDVKLPSGVPFESNLGEYGLAWLGTIVLFFAITFLWQYFNNVGMPIISLFVGVVSVAGVFLMSHYFKIRFTYLSYIFNLLGYIILYYIILRLHYYNNKPIVTNQMFATILILGVIVVQLYFAIKKHSQVLAGLACTLAIITAFVCNNIHAFFLISIVTTCLVVFTFWKYSWWKSLIFILSFSYLIFIIWLLKNNTTINKSPDDIVYYLTFIYFSITTAIYSLVVFKKPNEINPESSILLTILLAGIAYSVLLLFLVVGHNPSVFISFFIAISIYSIAYSVILKYYSSWKYSPALYALYGFVAISIAVYDIFHFPDSFLLLTYQSFLVLVLAIWYRSHIITLINTFLLLILILIYYKTSGTLNSVNFSIPIVAFFSARIINWKKERLNIKTDFIRNIYLFTLFFSLLFATYKGFPEQYITVSWLLITGIYFGLSVILKNIKYRWMAMANLLVSAFHLFLIDLAKTDPVFRILAFIIFAIVSISISTYYVKKIKDKNTENK
ncbi:MAG: hypothetical protein HOO91_21285 [Bacteroidales bacterium]|nr:hypothetical protein [Bacteroidales bacterium]